jgi:TRAP-type C4-dicarboxylate transport system permease small subunit
VATIIAKINYLLERLLMTMMAAIVVTVTWQVVSRFILADPSSITEELARFLLIWIGVLGAAYAYHTRAHLGFDLFVNKLAGRQRLLTKVFIEIMVAVFAACVLIYGGGSLTSLTLELKQSSAALGLQMGYIYSVIPLSGVLVLLYCAANIEQLAKQWGED